MASIEFKISEIRDVHDYWSDKMPMMAMEELGELIRAISKVEREKNWDTMENVKDEIRDVYISLAALQCRYGIPFPQINEAISMKLSKKYEEESEQ